MHLSFPLCSPVVCSRNALIKSHSQLFQWKWILCNGQHFFLVLPMLSALLQLHELQYLHVQKALLVTNLTIPDEASTNGNSQRNPSDTLDIFPLLNWSYNKSPKRLALETARSSLFKTRTLLVKPTFNGNFEKPQNSCPLHKDNIFSNHCFDTEVKVLVISHVQCFGARSFITFITGSIWGQEENTLCSLLSKSSPTVFLSLSLSLRVQVLSFRRSLSLKNVHDHSPQSTEGWILQLMVSALLKWFPFSIRLRRTLKKHTWSPFHVSRLMLMVKSCELSSHLNDVTHKKTAVSESIERCGQFLSSLKSIRAGNQHEGL